MLIDKREIERVKQANELVGFIRSRGVSLTQRGKQLVGLCPFHDDHEPSLVVDPRKQLWNCLGACREGGDVYRFVMKADGVDFREAHRRLGGHEAESKCVTIEDQQWLERAVDHYHARLLETPVAAQPGGAPGLSPPGTITTASSKRNRAHTIDRNSGSTNSDRPARSGADGNALRHRHSSRRSTSLGSLRHRHGRATLGCSSGQGPARSPGAINRGRGALAHALRYCRASGARCRPVVAQTHQGSCKIRTGQMLGSTGKTR